jgi:hypothetical protein
MVTSNAINSQNNLPYVSVVSPINLLNTGSTKIFTTISGINSFLCIAVLVQILTSNTFATPASISIGTNGASYNNILAITALTGLSVVGNYLQVPIVALATGAATSTDIYVNVTTGAGAIALTARVILIGVNL